MNHLFGAWSRQKRRIGVADEQIVIGRTDYISLWEGDAESISYHSTYLRLVLSLDHSLALEDLSLHMTYLSDTAPPWTKRHHGHHTSQQ